MTSYILRWFTRQQTVTHPSTNPAVHGWEFNSQPVDHKSDALTTTPPSLLVVVVVVVIVVVVSAGYYSMLPSPAQSDLSNLHRHLLDIKSTVSMMSASTSSGVGSGSRHDAGPPTLVTGPPTQPDDRLLFTVRQSDSSTL